MEGFFFLHALVCSGSRSSLWLAVNLTAIDKLKIHLCHIVQEKIIERLEKVGSWTVLQLLIYQFEPAVFEM